MAPQDDTQYIGLPTRNPDGGPDSPNLSVSQAVQHDIRADAIYSGMDTPQMPDTPMLNEPYTPPLGRDPHLQPSPSFLNPANRDSSYADSLNSEAPSAPGGRASWGSNALVCSVDCANRDRS